MDPGFLSAARKACRIAIGAGCIFRATRGSRTIVRDRWFKPSAGILWGASCSRPGAPAFADALKSDAADYAGAGRPIIWSFNARNPNPYADP
jgi:hypothetical protein